MNIDFEKMLKFNKELYSKTALIKAAYNFTDKAYVHLDADDQNYYVSLSAKEESTLISRRLLTCLFKIYFNGFHQYTINNS